MLPNRLRLCTPYISHLLHAWALIQHQIQVGVRQRDLTCVRAVHVTLTPVGLLPVAQYSSTAVQGRLVGQRTAVQQWSAWCVTAVLPVHDLPSISRLPCTVLACLPLRQLPHAGHPHLWQHVSCTRAPLCDQCGQLQKAQPPCCSPAMPTCHAPCAPARHRPHVHQCGRPPECVVLGRHHIQLQPRTHCVRSIGDGGLLRLLSRAMWQCSAASWLHLLRCMLQETRHPLTT